MSDQQNSEVLIADKRGVPKGQIEVVGTITTKEGETTHLTQVRNTTSEAVIENNQPIAIADKRGNVTGEIKVTSTHIKGPDVSYTTSVKSQ